jgi:hypothetical protein
MLERYARKNRDCSGQRSEMKTSMDDDYKNIDKTKCKHKKFE